MRSSNWTTDEIEILHKHYEIDGPTVLAKVLNRSVASVQRKAYYEGLTSDNTNTEELRKLRRTHNSELTMKRLEDPEKRRRHREVSRIAYFERRKRRRENRQCIRCGKPCIEHSTQFCLLHWVTFACGYNCGRYDEAFGRMLLAKLESQDFICALTGEKLIPGLNTSVDHIVPKSKGGGPDDLDNIQWVTVHANHAKYDRTVEEFVDFCRRVVSWYEK